MSELEPLTITQQVDGVITDHVPTAYPNTPTSFVGPRADLTIPTPQLT